MKTLSLTFIAMALLLTTVAKATEGNSYLSDVDKSLSIHKMGILPPTDNMNGLYSRYVEEKLLEKAKKSHRFDTGELKDIDGHLTLEDYEENPSFIKKAGGFNKVDAFLAGRVNKTKENLILILDLFLASDGLLFAQEQIELPENTGTDELSKKTGELYDKVIEKIPYRGLVLSREGNRVTINLGSQDGVKDNTTATIVEIIGLKRHPKFHFVVSSEKIILGKIKIVKTDETLSFGLITQEQERGVITTDSKITGVDFVTYPEAMGQPDVKEDTVSFGKNPKEWTPQKKPGFGKVALELGAGTLSNAVATQNEGSLSSQVALYPQMNLTGELWLTPTWFLAARIEEGIMATPNPLSGSAPQSLNAVNSHYSIHGGYKFFLEDDYTGPEIDSYLGIGEYSFFVDTSIPTAYTSLLYYGVYFGVKGSLPLTREKDWYINAAINYYFSPGLTETRVNSGTSSNNTATEFSIGGSHKMVGQLWLTGKLDFEFYGSTYSGVGTRVSPVGGPDSGINSSQSLFTLLVGIEFIF